MRGQEIKKGDTVCIIDASKNDYAFLTETTVVSSGSKYITTMYSGNNNKFGTETHHSEYLGYILYKGTKEECQEYINERNESRKLLIEVSRYFNYGEPDPKLVKEVYQKIQELKS